MYFFMWLYILEHVSKNTILQYKSKTKSLLIEAHMKRTQIQFGSNVSKFIPLEFL